MVPDLRWMYQPDKGGDEDRYRTGGRQLAPPIALTKSTSFQDRWAEEAEKRGIVAHPDVWKTMSDAKKVVASEMLTGNRPLPPTYWNYHTMWRQILEWAQRTRRGGLTSRNWLRMEMKIEDIAEDNKSDPLSPGWLIADEVQTPTGQEWTVVGSPPVRSRLTPTEGLAPRLVPGRSAQPPENRYRPEAHATHAVERSRHRCGSRAPQATHAVEVGDRILLTQHQYDEKLMYAVTTHKMEVMMQSISAATQVGYRRSWRQWMSFCRGQNHSIWLGSREEGWGGNLVNFILSEHDVLGLRSSTIRGKVSAIRFFHLVSGEKRFHARRSTVGISDQRVSDIQ